MEHKTEYACKHAGTCKQEHTYHGVCFQDEKDDRTRSEKVNEAMSKETLTVDVAKRIFGQAMDNRLKAGMTVDEAKLDLLKSLMQAPQATGVHPSFNDAVTIVDGLTD